MDKNLRDRYLIEIATSRGVLISIRPENRSPTLLQAIEEDASQGRACSYGVINPQKKPGEHWVKEPFSLDSGVRTTESLLDVTLEYMKKPKLFMFTQISDVAMTFQTLRREHNDDWTVIDEEVKHF